MSEQPTHGRRASRLDRDACPEFLHVHERRQHRVADAAQSGVAIALRDAVISRDTDAICAVTRSVAAPDAYLSALALLRTQIRFVGGLEVDRLIAGRSLNIPVMSAALEGHLRLLHCLEELATTPVGALLAPPVLTEHLITTVYVPLHEAVAFVAALTADAQKIDGDQAPARVMPVISTSVAVMHFIAEQYGVPVDEQRDLAHQSLTVAIGAVPITR